MVISLRGTSGAGKTYLVRQIMKCYDVKTEIRTSGRRHPIGYTLDSTKIPVKQLFVPGHYESSTPNGGVDTLGQIKDVYDLIWDHYDLGDHVLYEGKNMSDGVSRIASLFDIEQVQIVVLDHPVEKCIEAVRERGHKISADSITKTHAKVMRDADKFRLLGYKVYYLEREKALEKIKFLLAITL